MPTVIAAERRYKHYSIHLDLSFYSQFCFNLLKNLDSIYLVPVFDSFSISGGCDNWLLSYSINSTVSWYWGDADQAV